jgi:phospholipid/cholesterol/gamma-HCH transport system substrate-binding protein
MRRAVTLVALAVVAGSTGGCGVLGGGGGGYHITAEFERAVGLYEQSIVKIMGADAGTVDSVEVDGDLVRVEMTINDDVPLPADVMATIAPLTLIGERNVVLSPPWHPGEPRLEDGAVLRFDADPALSRTVIPVEPDEILQALTDLAEAIDPEAVGRLLDSGAEAIDGQGTTFNEMLVNTRAVTTSLADQDEQILEAARNLNVVATSLNTRSAQLGHLVDALSEASSVLAAERDSIAAFLDGIVRLSDVGGSLLDAYQGQLPADIAHLADLALVLESSLGSLDQLVAAFPTIAEELVDAYDTERGLLVLNISLSPVASQGLAPLFDVLGLPVPCIPLLGDVTCP